MASHNNQESFRRKSECEFAPQWKLSKSGDWVHNALLRPGKTAEDKRIGAWRPKSERPWERVKA